MGNRAVQTYVSSSQRELLLLLASGRTMKAIAHEIGVSLRCINMRAHRLRARFCVSSRTALVVSALQQRVIMLDEIDVEYMEE